MDTILVFADTHGRNLEMFDIVERVQPMMVLHAGDHADDARELQLAYPNLDVRFVGGNNDYGADDPERAIIKLQKQRIYMTHGHRERVHGTNPGRVSEMARMRECTIAIYGHTHCSVLEKQAGVWVLNPGSPTLPRDKMYSYAEMTVKNGRVVEITVREVDGAVIRSATV